MTTTKNAEVQQLSPLEQWADNSILFFFEKIWRYHQHYEKLVGILIMPNLGFAPI